MAINTSTDRKPPWPAAPCGLTVTEALTLYAAFYDNPVEPVELIEQLGLTLRPSRSPSPGARRSC